MTLVNAHSQSAEPNAMNPSTEKLSHAIEHWDATHALPEAIGAELADYHLQCICMQRPRDIAPDRACKAVGLPEGYYWSEVVSAILDKNPSDHSGREYTCELLMAEYLDELCALLRQFGRVSTCPLPMQQVPLLLPRQAISSWLVSIDDALSMLDRSAQEGQGLMEQLHQLKGEIERSKT